MLWEDLERYNETGSALYGVKRFGHMLRQAYTHPGLIAVVVFRFGGWTSKVRIPVIRQLLELTYHLGYTAVRFGLQIEVPRNTLIGDGFRIDHYGSILINSQAKIGSNFTVTQGVLVGATESGAPTIGDDVHCGVGSKIIGGISLGSNIKIGAGTIVTNSFDGNVVLAGVPARVLRTIDEAPAKSGWIPPRESADGAAS